MRRDQNPESVEACAERLLWTRLALGLKQAEICRQTKIAPAAWNNAETADNKLGLENALKLCRRYSLTLDWLYRGNIDGIPGDLARRIGKVEADMAVKSA